MRIHSYVLHLIRFLYSTKEIINISKRDLNHEVFCRFPKVIYTISLRHGLLVCINEKFPKPLLSYLITEHIGTVRCASGNSTVERWALRKLKLSYYLFTYNSLLKLHGSSSLLKALDDLLLNESILQLDLKSLQVAFKDPNKRRWYQIILDNTLKLWEVNMS